MLRNPCIMVALLLLAPGASAFSITMESPEGRLEPEAGGQPVTLTASATCEEVWERRPPAQGAFLEMAITSTSDPEISIEGPATIIFETESCTAPTQDTVEAKGEFSFSATRAAAGLRPLPFSLTAELTGGEHGEPVTDQVESSVEVAYYDAMHIEVEQPIREVDVGEDAVFAATVTNLGNAAAILRFVVAETPHEALTVVLPDDITVPSIHDEGDNTVDVTFVLRYDTDAAGILDLLDGTTIRVENRAVADEAEEGTPITASLLLRVRDAKGVPAPSPLFVVGVLAAALLAARRRA